MVFLLSGKRRLRLLSLVTLLVIVFSPLIGMGKTRNGGETETLEYLKKLSIEDLLQTQITSVSKKPETLFDAAAAVTVITGEDIRRTGARSIPDVLRLVPGLQVGRIDSSKWEIGSRGFSDYFENKLLVLMDGRSMYTPLYAGVYWNTLDTVLEDIDRIEVIRGPGATVWGANAVNGVINIITKNSADTQGGFLSATYGTQDQPLVAARYGDKLSEESSYRLYAKGFQRDSFENFDGSDSDDNWSTYRAGMRFDSRPEESATLSIQAEVYSGEADFTSVLSGFLTPPFVRRSTETEEFDGGHMQVNYQHVLTEESVVDVQFYYDGYRRDLTVAEEIRHTLDLELQHRIRPLAAHEIVYGAGVRWSDDDIDGTFFTSFVPPATELYLWNAFIQDDIELVEDAFWLTLGSKFEHNDFTGFEIQPSVRFRWKPADDQLFWGAVSRAVRTPSRSEQDIVINLATIERGPSQLAVVRLQGSDSFDSEELIAYELGYRWQQSENLSFDVATFYNDYDNLRFTESAAPFFTLEPVPLLVLPEVFNNGLEGESYGIELSASWQPLLQAKITLAYSWMNLNLDFKDAGNTGTPSVERSFPRHQIVLTGQYDLHKNLCIDGELYYVDDFGEDDIDDYLRLDLQLHWQPFEMLELSIGGENLFSSSHTEAIVNGTNVVSTEVGPIYWLKGTIWF